MRILLCIDDTDNLDSRGTGELASLIARDIERNGWGTTHCITRHQLLVHPDIPYTSHNSSMCFAADIDEAVLESVIHHASGFLARESAEGSDPGLCVAVVDRLEGAGQLIAFGQRAKESVIAMDDAYRLARQLGIHLSEHGGTGQGVIGALAGAGLRLSGSDGRLKGHLRIDAVDGVATVGGILSHAGVDTVRSLCGDVPGDEELVSLGEKVKNVLLDGKSVLLVAPSDDPAAGTPWQTCAKHHLRKY